MQIERNEMLHPKLGVDGVQFSVYLSNFCDDDLDEAMAAWIDSDDEVGISCNFRLTEALDSIIELHEMPACGHAIDENARPLIDAVRAELVKMIERIDALKFTTPNVKLRGRPLLACPSRMLG